jgi:HEAT repeat protein
MRVKTGIGFLLVDPYGAGEPKMSEGRLACKKLQPPGPRSRALDWRRPKWSFELHGNRSMLEPEAVQELTGIARSIDALFLRLEGESGASPLAVESAAEAAAGVELLPPPLPDVAGSAPVREGAPPEAAQDVDPLPLLEEVEVASPPPLPDEVALATSEELSAGAEFHEAPPPLPLLEESPEVDAPAPADGGGAPVTQPALAPAPASEREADAGEEEEPTALDLAVDRYIEGDPGVADEVERLGAEMLEARELDSLARSVVRLAVAAGEPPDASVYAVAESIMTSTVQEHMVRQLGRERVEEARHEYYQACRTIGAPIAQALRDGLADTATDRLARRNFCDALLAMGDAARPTIDEMATDDNRFVCRNALAILGELGGERARELVTLQLGNPDARVRREALRSLARIGDDQSGVKLMELGLLEDSDEDVRVAAAITAGELRVGRALKPLIAMLEATKDPDRAIPLIRALGQLEDPAAVTPIERFAVPSLFSKPQTNVRIAAYRALYHIGTPHAMKLLAKASSDKDAEVASAVLALRSSAPRSSPDEEEGA